MPDICNPHLVTLSFIHCVVFASSVVYVTSNRCQCRTNANNIDNETFWLLCQIPCYSVAHKMQASSPNANELLMDFGVGTQRYDRENMLKKI